MALLSKFELSALANVFSGYATTVWSVLLQLFLIPLYIKTLGAEGYGLIGFYLTIQAILQILDFGLTPAISREIARNSVAPDKLHDARDLTRTLECLYWFLSMLIGLAITVLAPLLAEKWLSVRVLPIADVQTCIVLMGIATIFQWPVGFYNGGLLGLQRQGLINTLNVVFNTMFGIGAIVLLVWISPSLQLFFAWRALVSFVQVVFVRFILWKLLMQKSDPHTPIRFRPGSLARIWRFALGMAGISVFTSLITQADKIVLSKVIPMELFGYYMLAFSVSGLIPQLMSPIASVAAPRFNRLIAANDGDGQRRELHLWAQLITVVIHPIALTLAAFSTTIILLWTGNEAAAHYASPVLSVLAIGYLLNSVMVIPHNLQFAHGWTRLALTASAVLAVLIVPYTMLAGSIYGGVGAASNLIILNLIAIGITIPPTFRTLMPGEGIRWLTRDLGLPFLCILGTVILLRKFMPVSNIWSVQVFQILLALGCSYAVALVTAGEIRRKLPTVLPTSK